MESLGTIPEGAWNSYNGMCYEEADFMAHLVGNCSVPSDVLSSSHYQTSSCWPNQEANSNVVGFYDSSIYSSDEIDINTYSFPEESSHGGGSGIRFPESYYPNMSQQQFFVASNSLTTMDYSNNATERGHFLDHDVNNDIIDSNENANELPMPERMEEDKVTSPSTKKRLRIPRDVQRSKRSMKLKESVKVDDDNDENNSDFKKVVPRRENSSSSEDDNELNGLVLGSSRALNSNGKTRANRGSATDPQSLYARKRRERINERLRILQTIVPNGTKVDISTMLEEAVQYVKFLQLQIKLLSSDQHWMYAPIAYNGMDIGLDLRNSTPNSQT